MTNGSSVVERLPLAQVVIPGSWDWVVSRLPRSAYVPASLSGSLMNKFFLKRWMEGNIQQALLFLLINNLFHRSQQLKLMAYEMKFPSLAKGNLKKEARLPTISQELSKVPWGQGRTMCIAHCKVPAAAERASGCV